MGNVFTSTFSSESFVSTLFTVTWVNTNQSFNSFSLLGGGGVVWRQRVSPPGSWDA